MARGISSAVARELEASLLRELMRYWRELNVRHFGEALAPPVLRLIESATVLARYCRISRTIEFSRSLVFEQPWGSVVEVLKHEMAHQYVYEVLQVVDESAHGPAFRLVCERAHIDAAARGLPSGPAAAEEAGASRVLKRVADLLALARSPNQHEAESAAAMAQRLMLKHNIASSQRPERLRYGYRHLGSIKGRVPEVEHIVAAILAQYFFVEAIWVPGYRPLDQVRGSVLEICGTPDNLEMAGYAHAFLLEAAERLWAQHKREQGIRGNRDRRAFVAGVAEGFRERLRREKETCQERGLVWVADADLSKYHRERHPSVRSVRVRGSASGQSRAQGREAGRKLILHRGLDTPTRARGRMLPPGR